MFSSHNIPPGHSDAPHHEIYPTDPHVGSYETESQHANRQAHPEDNSFKQYGKENQFRPAFNAMSSEDAKKRTKELWKIPFKPTEAWIHMTHALKTLINHGYDSTEAEYLLPVTESEVTYPGAEEAMEKFYNHILHRLTPAWRVSGNYKYNIKKQLHRLHRVIVTKTIVRRTAVFHCIDSSIPLCDCMLYHFINIPVNDSISVL